jgi:hypothetical protein
MTSRPRGNATSRVDVCEIGPDGFTLRIAGESIPVPFADFPWFRGASEADLRDVSRPHAYHLRWEALDVDLTLDSLRHPERYPLIAKG